MDIKNLPIVEIKNGILILQVVTAIVGSIYFSKYKHTILKYLLYLLWYVVINDTIAGYYSEHICKYNAAFYNVFQLVSFTLYLSIFKDAIKSLKFKKIISFFIVAYYITFFINILISNFKEIYFSFSYVFGALFIISSIIMFYSEILNSDKIININRMLIFWVSIGLLVSFLPNIPFYIIRKYYIDSPTIHYIFITKYFLVFTNNILLISGFIWSNKEQKD
jgi:hypothetical protein